MNDYAQLLSLLTGEQQQPSDIQPTGNPNWMQWLLQNRGSTPGAGGSSQSGLSGLGAAMGGNMGGGATSGIGKGLISGL